MRFTNLTRSNEIGANCYLLQTGGKGLLLDCGNHPKLEGLKGTPRLELLKDKPLHGVCISHGHLDHLGCLPMVMEEYPGMKAYSTHATKLIADRALHNSASVMIKQRQELDIPEYPLYTHGQVDRILRNVESVPYHRSIELEDWTIRFFESGHVLGAAGIWVEEEGHSLFYTGDVKFRDMMITRGARFPDRKPDTVVLECTRGGVEPDPARSWTHEIKRLGRAIHQTLERKGSVLIPSFALGKMQEVLKLLHDCMDEGVLTGRKIWTSGLGISYTEIYDELADMYPRVCPGFRLEDRLDLEVLQHRQAGALDLSAGQIMVLTSGMMMPHTLSHAMATRMAQDEKSSIFFVGYVDPDSPAGHLAQAEKAVPVDMGERIGKISFHCERESFDLTSHCNRDEMVEYVTGLAPRNLLLVHGDPSCLEWFRMELGQRLPEARIMIPESGETIDL